MLYFSSSGVFIRQVEVDWREMCMKLHLLRALFYH